MFETTDAELSRIREVYVAAGEKAVKAALVEFMAAHPSVSQVQLKMWVPGFNDGEPCTFTLGGCEVNLGEPVSTEDGDDEDSERFLDLYSLSDLPKPESESLKKDMQSLDEFLDSNADAVERIFGSNSCVVVGRDGQATIMEYDCGY